MTLGVGLLALQDRVTLGGETPFCHVSTLSLFDSPGMGQVVCANFVISKMAANAKSQSKPSAKSQDKRWPFTSAMIESLINCLKQYKFPYEFNSVDCNPELYEKIR